MGLSTHLGPLAARLAPEHAPPPGLGNPVASLSTLTAEKAPCADGPRPQDALRAVAADSPRVREEGNS